MEITALSGLRGAVFAFAEDCSTGVELAGRDGGRLSEDSQEQHTNDARGAGPRPEKAAIVAEIRERLNASGGVVLAEYRGLDTKVMSSLRKSLRSVGGSFVVYKNTMVRFAVRQLDIECEHLLVGPTGLAFVEPLPDGSSPDAAAVAKVLMDFRRSFDKLIIKGGILGASVVGPDEVERLSRLPSADEMRVMTVGAIVSPLQRLAALTAAPMREMASLLGAPSQNFAGLLRALIDRSKKSP